MLLFPLQGSAPVPGIAAPDHAGIVYATAP
jgi:hypothetical protein